MFRKLSTAAAYSKLTPTPSKRVSPHRITGSGLNSSHSQPLQWSNPLIFKSNQKRRVENSPTLQSDAVTLPDPIRERVQKFITRQKLTPRQIRSLAKPMTLMRSPESLVKKVTRKRGQPVVLPPPTYDQNGAAAFAAIRMPGTFASNVFVLAEAARQAPKFEPKSILDFGSGPGTSIIAAARVFSKTQTTPSMPDCHDQLHTIHSATLVDSSADMRSFAAELADVDPWISSFPSMRRISSLEECQPRETFDIVSCSYSLNEIVREAMSTRAAHASTAPGEDSSPDQPRSLTRGERRHLAENRLRRIARALWSRTAPNGLFVIIEDGTAAGFETVSFVRNAILRTSPPLSVLEYKSDLPNAQAEQQSSKGLEQQENLLTTAHVIAPCLHSITCPLSGSITRHRICRFQQRLNRPPYTRTIQPITTGHEDEYFSFLVVQKLVVEEQEKGEMLSAKNPGWGRLIRPPLQKGKHIKLDACTHEAKLERRVVSKKNAPEGMYSLARRARWGDVWTRTPSTAPQPVNF